MAAPDATRATPASVRRGAKRHRLSGAAAFQAVFANGHKREGRYVQLVHVEAGEGAAEGGRYGFVVGRKALPRAVDRNRFKRIVRERLRQVREQASRYDLVIRLKRPVPRDAVDAAAAEAVALIDRCLLSPR